MPVTCSSSWPFCKENGCKTWHSWGIAAVCTCAVACFFVSRKDKLAWLLLCQETKLMSMCWSPWLFPYTGNCKSESKPGFFATTAFLSFTHDGPRSLPFQIIQSICSRSLSPKVTNTSCWRRGKPYCSWCLCCDLARRRISSLLLDWFRSCSMMLYVPSKTFRYFSLFI